MKSIDDWMTTMKNRIKVTKQPMPEPFAAVCDLLNQQKGIEARFTDFQNHTFFLDIKRRGTGWGDAPTFLCELDKDMIVSGGIIYHLGDPAIVEKLTKLALERS